MSRRPLMPLPSAALPAKQGNAVDAFGSEPMGFSDALVGLRRNWLRSLVLRHKYGHSCRAKHSVCHWQLFIHETRSMEHRCKLTYGVVQNSCVLLFGANLEPATTWFTALIDGSIA
jgi:hypothetical protein